MPRAITSIATKSTLFAVAVWVSGCQYFGPNSIEVGRPDYNSAIQNTSAQQVLANIVRVHDLKMPLVMDVTQINAALIVQGGITAGVAGIGGLSGLAGAGAVVATSPTAGALSTRVVSSRTGSVGGSFAYEENPTITYTPLSGQPLIAQLSAPITVDSLAALPDSEWPLPGVLELSVNYITPNYRDKDLALNSILELDWHGALTEAAAKSGLSRDISGVNGGSSQQRSSWAPALQQNTPGAPNDSLVLYLLPERADPHGRQHASEDILTQWIRLIKLYWATQPAMGSSELASSVATQNFTGAGMSKLLDDIVKQLNNPTAQINDLNSQFGSLPNWVELRTAPIAPDQTKPCNAPLSGPESPLKSHCISLSPVMRTRSAIGILLAATNQARPLIEFVSPGRYRDIRKSRWNTSDSWDSDIPEFYTGILDVNRCSDSQCKYVTNFIACYIANSAEIPLFTVSIDNEAVDKTGRLVDKCYTEYDQANWFANPFAPLAYLAEESLANSRRYVLVIMSDKPPQEALPDEQAYVSFESGGHWYFISDKDKVSKQNFAVITEFMSIMALPSQTAPPTPTIGVGGHG
jgi:hypothetical protein